MYENTIIDLVHDPVPKRLEKLTVDNVIYLSEKRPLSLLSRVEPGWYCFNRYNDCVYYNDYGILRLLFDTALPLELGFKFIENPHYRKHLHVIPDGTPITYDQVLTFYKEGDCVVSHGNPKELRFKI